MRQSVGSEQAGKGAIYDLPCQSPEVQSARSWRRQSPHLGLGACDNPQPQPVHYEPVELG